MKKTLVALIASSFLGLMAMAAEQAPASCPKSEKKACCEQKKECCEQKKECSEKKKDCGEKKQCPASEKKADEQKK